MVKEVPKPTLHAVIVGVSKYKSDKLNLRYAAKDAEDFATAMRIANFCQFIEHANTLPASSDERGVTLDKAGHLMYASHLSYANDAKLSNDECDLLVELVRKNERKGLYGAKMSSDGRVVVILCETSENAARAIASIMSVYAEETELKPMLLRAAQTDPEA